MESFSTVFAGLKNKNGEPEFHEVLDALRGCQHQEKNVVQGTVNHPFFVFFPSCVLYSGCKMLSLSMVENAPQVEKPKKRCLFASAIAHRNPKKASVQNRPPNLHSDSVNRKLKIISFEKIAIFLGGRENQKRRTMAGEVHVGVWRKDRCVQVFGAHPHPKAASPLTPGRRPGRGAWAGTSRPRRSGPGAGRPRGSRWPG